MVSGWINWLKIRTVISRPQVYHASGIHLLPSVPITRLNFPIRREHFTIGIVGDRIDYRAAFICHLPHRAQRISQEILLVGAAHLRNPLQAIGIGVCPITQDLGQPGIEIILVTDLNTL